MATVAAYSSGDSLSSRLIASGTSAPPSVAFVPCGEVGETGGYPRNINNMLLSHVFQESKSFREDLALGFIAIKSRKCRHPKNIN